MEVQQADRRRAALGDFHVLSDDIICRILSLLSSHDIGNLGCTSSLDLTEDFRTFDKPSRQFQGFSSLFLYRRWYRCHVVLEGFALDNGVVERRSNVLPHEFSALYDGKKPVVLTDLLDDWPARKGWILDQLIQTCGDALFKVAQPYGKPISMTMKDFAGYMDLQHDEEPLYIFDPQFGESVPKLLNDYKVPTLFTEDFFSVLSESERPPFRWLVLGPARSGASWHVDPSLTSAWNSLLSGRKRWALYRPGKVPPGVTLDVDEDDGSVNYDGPTSLQWWLDVYPHLKEDDKPLEFTQLPGETIYVPSGWWHCVLNIDASIAMTQNFVNLNNLEIVCMDLAPGYRHRAIARAGRIALEGRTIAQSPENEAIDLPQANPIFRSPETSTQPLSDSKLETFADVALKDQNFNLSFDVTNLKSAKGKKSAGGVTDHNLLLALDSLEIHLEENQARVGDINNGKKMGDAMTRKWLRKLCIARPELEQAIWKGACRALGAGTWLHKINVICQALGFPNPAHEEKLPVGDGSNPVYFVGDYVIKLYIQEIGPAASIDGLGSELSFYALLKESGSGFQDVIPKFVASGILYSCGKDYKAVAWDGTGNCPQLYPEATTVGKKPKRDSTQMTASRFRTKWSGSTSTTKTKPKDPSAQESKFWPYLVTKRCPGRPLSELHADMSKDDVQSLATFLGKQVRLLHTLPLPAFEQGAWDDDYRQRSRTQDHTHKELPIFRHSKEAKYDNRSPLGEEAFSQPKDATSPALITTVASSRPTTDTAVDILSEVPKAWQLHVSYLRERRKNVHKRFEEWGSLPDHLLNQLEAYLPEDPVVLVGDVQVHNGMADIAGLPVWLHTDVMRDNIMVQSSKLSCSELDAHALDQMKTRPSLSQKDSVIQAWYIIDYGDLLHGDPIYDLLPIHLDVFNLKDNLLECFLRSYQLPFSSNTPKSGVRYVRGVGGSDGGDCENKLSYCAMCYCLLHELDAMAQIFKLRQDVRTAKSFGEIEDKIWGVLNDYVPEHSA